MYIFIYLHYNKYVATRSIYYLWSETTENELLLMEIINIETKQKILIVFRVFMKGN
jgi:hypothetical protein